MKRSVALGAFLVIALMAFVIGRYSTGSSSHASSLSKRRILYYVDPMHPTFHSDKPGIAPDCGMPLEPVYEDASSAASDRLPAGAVAVSPEKQQLIGILVETVRKNSGPRWIRSTGRVEADDNRVYRLMAATEGWVQSLENNPPGTMVKKNELLTTFYSREFRNAEQAYLGSLASLDRLKPDHESMDTSRMSDANLRINEEQLRALGMGEQQIKDLAKTRQITRDIALASPVDGIVLSRSASPEQRFEKGTELYRIGDLSKVWIIADVYGDEAQLFSPGANVRVTARELEKSFVATVTKNPPLFDPSSRTLKLRLEADNPGFLLRPGMFVDVQFSVHPPPGLSVPQEAVLDSGLQKIVYLEVGEGVFEPRQVEIGIPFGNRFTISRGLRDGDRVVTSGNFLLDSESRMRSTPLISSSSGRPAAEKSKQGEVSTQDAVCGMPLSSNNSSLHRFAEEYHGRTFVFCSERCQKKFRQNPSAYLVNKPGKPETPSEQMQARR